MTPPEWSALLARNLGIEIAILAASSLVVWTWDPLACGTLGAVVTTAVMAIAGNVILARRVAGSLTVFLLALQAVYVEWPLRLITGRRKPGTLRADPDAARVAGT